MCVCICVCVRVFVCECLYLSGILPQDDAPTMVKILRILNLLCTLSKMPIFEKLLLSRVLLEEKRADNGLMRKTPSQHTTARCNTLHTLHHAATHYNTHLSGISPEDNRAGNGLVRKAPLRLQGPVADFVLKYLPCIKWNSFICDMTHSYVT